MFVFISFAVLAIQAKKKRKNPKGRKSGNPPGNKEQDGPSTPGSNNSGNNVNSRETRSSQPR